MRLQVQEVETQRQEENSEMGDGSGFSKSEMHWCSYLFLPRSGNRVSYKGSFMIGHCIFPT